VSLRLIRAGSLSGDTAQTGGMIRTAAIVVSVPAL